MRKIIFGMALLGAAVAVSPASAQGYGYQNGGGGQRIAAIGQRINALEQRGRIDPREAYRLRAERDSLINLGYRYRRNGLTRSENNDIYRRTARLERAVANAGRRGDRYDRNDRYDRDDRRDRYDD
jgi:hypothetical protein